MKETYILLGKWGDQLSILPCVHEDFRITGVKPTLIVSKEYSQIALGLDCVDAVIYDGSWQDLAGAVKFAKERYDNVVIAQTFGIDYPIMRKHPSFQLDQWDRASRLEQWGTLPLVLPRGSSSAEIPKQPFILYGDHSESSPFQFREDLFSLLQDIFPPHTIVRLSSIRLPRVLDLLALMDAAELMVCVESMPLHLSAACKTPVIALATDVPSRWHGSAYHPRMALHVRYGDYEARKSELVHVAKRAVNKQPTIQPTIVQTAHEHGYNLSIMQVGTSLLKTYRYHPNPASWRTELALECDGVTKPIIVPKQYYQHSHEDGRMFMLRGKPHLSCTISRSRVNGQSVDPSVTGFGELAERNNGWVLENWIEPNHGNNNWTGQCKNLVFWEHNGRLLCTWQTFPSHVVLELNDKGWASQSWKSASPPCPFGEYRGGTQMFPYEGNWLRFVHANRINRKSDLWWHYSLAAIVIESKPPFRILKVSQQPILTGTELYTPDCKHWKARVTIPYGAVVNGEGWDVAVGLNDCQCGIVFVHKDNLNL